MMQKYFPAYLFLVVLLTGCASEWALRTESSGTVLQWPYPPQNPKVVYRMALKGFSQATNSRSVLKTIVYGNEAADDSFRLPVAVSAGHDGRLAVADIGLKCVHLYLPGKKRYIRLYGSDKEPFVSPVGVVFDDEERLYVSDSVAAKVFIFSSEGAFLSSFDLTDKVRLKRPTGLAFNSEKKLIYVADTLENRIYAYNTEGKVVFGFGERGEGNGQFNFPAHIFWSPTGRLYVADTMNFRIEIFDGEGRFIGSFGRHGDGSGDIAMPKGLAADKDGVIYVADSLFDNVQLFESKGKFLLTVGSRGTQSGEFWMPSGAFIDENGLLYICDTYNGRVEIFRIVEHYADRS